ncbi:MAG: PaaI family thioesterase [Candidatus Korobacteraceae bacterium]
MTQSGPAGTAASRKLIKPDESLNADRALLDRLHRGVQADPSLMPFGSTVGLSVELIREGEAVVVLQTDERHENIVGYTHGGVLFTLADTAIGLAHLSTLREQETATTVEIKINYLRPVWHTRLRAHGRMVKRGKLLSLLECDLHDGDGRLVARASGTMMTVPQDKTVGRGQFHFKELESD